MISETMYARHRAQNYLAVEKRKEKHKRYLESANRYRDIVSRNCYRNKQPCPSCGARMEGIE